MTVLQDLKQGLATSVIPVLEMNGFKPEQPRRVFSLRYIREDQRCIDVIEFIFFKGSTCKFRVQFRPIEGERNINIVLLDRDKMWYWAAGYDLSPNRKSGSAFGFGGLLGSICPRLMIARTVRLTTERVHEMLDFLDGAPPKGHIFKSFFWDDPHNVDVLEKPSLPID